MGRGGGARAAVKIAGGGEMGGVFPPAARGRARARVRERSALGRRGASGTRGGFRRKLGASGSGAAGGWGVVLVRPIGLGGSCGAYRAGAALRGLGGLP